MHGSVTKGFNVLNFLQKPASPYRHCRLFVACKPDASSGCTHKRTSSFIPKILCVCPGFRNSSEDIPKDHGYFRCDNHYTWPRQAARRQKQQKYSSTPGFSHWRPGVVVPQWRRPLTAGGQCRAGRPGFCCHRSKAAANASPCSSILEPFKSTLHACFA